MIKKAWLTTSLIVAVVGGGLAVLPPTLKSAAIASSLQEKIAQTTDAESSVQIEILNPGAEPRQTLRFQPKLQTKQLTTITQTVGASTDDFEPQTQSPKPGIIMKVETTVTKIEPNGNIHYQFQYTDVRWIHDVLEQLKPQLAKAKNVMGEVAIDSRGQMISVEYVTPVGADDSLQQLTDEMVEAASEPSMIFPETAVGVGAKWQIVSVPKAFGSGFLPMITTYELASLQDGRATLNIVATLPRDAKPPSQKFSDPAFESSLTGQGQIVIQLDRVMPINSKLVMQSKRETKPSSSGTNQPTAIQLNNDLEIVVTSE